MTEELFDKAAVISGLLLAALTLPGSFELAMLTIAGLFPSRRDVESVTDRRLRLAVVVPAHDEEGSISRCVSSLLDCDRTIADFGIFVVADNCTDSTAARAREAGAEVLVRNDSERRGKGYALDFAFQKLIEQGFDAAIVVDADTVVETNFITSFARLFAQGADAVQCRYTVNNSDASLRTRLMNLALMAFNVLRPRGRDRLGLSVGLLGNGFGVTFPTLRDVPYSATSVVEDLEYHLRLISAGRLVRFADRTTVKADMPVGGKGARTQRARWEGGRLRMAASQAPRLAARVIQGRVRLLEPLLELSLLPLAFHFVLLIAALAPPFAPTRVYALAGLLVVALHILAAIRVGGGGTKDFAALLSAPFYIAWKLAMIPWLLLSSRRGADWIRTERANTEGEKV